LLLLMLLSSTLCGLLAGGSDVAPMNLSVVLTVFGEGDFVTHSSYALRSAAVAVEQYQRTEGGCTAELLVIPVGTDTSWTYKKRELLLIALENFADASGDVFERVTRVRWEDVVSEHEGSPTAASIARAMNKGAELARGDVILFVAGHVLLERDAIAPLVSALDPRLLGKDSSLTLQLQQVDSQLQAEAELLEELLTLVYGQPGAEDPEDRREDEEEEQSGQEGSREEENGLGGSEEEEERSGSGEDIALTAEDHGNDGTEGDSGVTVGDDSGGEGESNGGEERPHMPQMWPVRMQVEQQGTGVACGLLSTPWGTVSDAGLALFMDKTPECKGKHKWSKKRLVSNDCSSLDPRKMQFLCTPEEEDEEGGEWSDVCRRRERLTYAATRHWQLLDEEQRGIEGRKWPTLLYEHTAFPFPRLEGEHLLDRRLQGDRQDITAGTGLLMAVPQNLFTALGGFDEAYLNSESSARYTCNFAALEFSLLANYVGWKTVLVPTSRGVAMESLEKEVVAATANEVTDGRLFGMRWRDVASGMVEEQFASRQPVAWDMECQAGETLGFTIEAVGIVASLEPLLPLTVIVSNKHQCMKDMKGMELQPHLLRTLDRLISKSPSATATHVLDSNIELVAVLHHDPGRFDNFKTRHNFETLLVVGRSMYETDTIPHDWLRGCSLEVDELWVPSAFNMETFSSAGVDEAKLFVVPEPVDVYTFDGSLYSNEGSEKITVFGDDSGDHFTFLTVMKWEERKAWRELFTAFVAEFSDELVRLLVRSSMEDDENWQQMTELMDELAAVHAGRQLPPIVVLEERVPFWRMASLYATADAFVLASHGEGWGLPLVQAMSMGLPTIGTNWSGNTEFMTADNSLLVDVEDLVEVDHLTGHRWAMPSHVSLRARLREAYELSPADRLVLAKRAREGAERFAGELVAQKVLERVLAFEANKDEVRARAQQRELELEAVKEEEKQRQAEEARAKREAREEERKASRSKMFGSWVKNAIEEVEKDGKTLYKVPIVDH